MTSYCPNCGSEFTKEAKFCQTCGCNLESEFMEKPTCPNCKTTYPANTTFCVNDGYKLVIPDDLIPKCVICNTAYSDNTKFCTLDGGVVKVILPGQFQQPAYSQQSFQKVQPNQKYPKASLGDRFLAALLDGLITTGLSIPAILFFLAAREKINSYDDDGVSTLILFAILFYLFPLIYSLTKDGLGQGQSWGKRPLDLMVVNLDNNTPCSTGKSFFRNIISTLIALIAIIPPIGWLIESIMVLTTHDGRKLGDKAANTQVIDKKYYN